MTWYWIKGVHYYATFFLGWHEVEDGSEKAIQMDLWKKGNWMRCERNQLSYIQVLSKPSFLTLFAFCNGHPVPWMGRVRNWTGKEVLFEKVEKSIASCSLWWATYNRILSPQSWHNLYTLSSNFSPTILHQLSPFWESSSTILHPPTSRLHFLPISLVTRLILMASTWNLLIGFHSWTFLLEEHNLKEYTEQKEIIPLPTLGWKKRWAKKGWLTHTHFGPRCVTRTFLKGRDLKLR